MYFSTHLRPSVGDEFVERWNLVWVLCTRIFASGSSVASENLPSWAPSELGQVVSIRPRRFCPRPYDRAAHTETPTPEPHLIVLGMWTREMRARGESVNTEWARKSHATGSRLRGKQTCNVTAIAVGQQARKNEGVGWR